MPIRGKGTGRDDLNWRVVEWRDIYTGKTKTRSGSSSFLKIDWARVEVTNPKTKEQTYLTIWGPMEDADYIDEQIEYFFDEEDYNFV